MSVSELLETAHHKRILFVGERIKDVYHYVRPLGRPTKDAIVSVELVGTESFEGGVIAAKHHAEAICKYVDLYTTGRAYTKTRFVEESHVRKLFEFYDWNSANYDPKLPNIEAYDAVVVTDYGHGMMDSKIINALCQRARFLAVNVQTNSGNYGFNLATKYPRADYLCVDEPEARLATQNRSDPLEHSLDLLRPISPRICITLGKSGAIALHGGEIKRCHAFTDKIVDTMGAGDAFFAVTACIAEQADIETLLRIGNAAGALKAAIVGHRQSITKGGLLELLQAYP